MFEASGASAASTPDRKMSTTALSKARSSGSSACQLISLRLRSRPVSLPRKDRQPSVSPDCRPADAACRRRFLKRPRPGRPTRPRSGRRRYRPARSTRRSRTSSPRFSPRTSIDGDHPSRRSRPLLPSTAKGGRLQVGTGVVAFRWNQWSSSIGIGGRLRVENAPQGRRIGGAARRRREDTCGVPRETGRT